MTGALHLNDARATFPDSWYAASVDAGEPRPPLEGDAETEVAVIGAGYTGLWAALTLAGRGIPVRVVDAHRAGFGASGRNGGQAGSGFNKPQTWLEERLGMDDARALWDLSLEAKSMVREFHIRRGLPFVHGIVHGDWSGAELRETRAEVDHLQTVYGYHEVEALDRVGLRAEVDTPAYVGGKIDRGALHIHPMRYALELADAAEEAGAVLHDRTEVRAIEEGPTITLRCDTGALRANHVIIAANGYLGSLHKGLAARVMPINSFIAATEPLGGRIHAMFPNGAAVEDSRFVVNYFRPSEDGRLLYGGRESYSLGFPKDIQTRLRARLTTIFPDLADAAFDHVWGGTLGITPTRLPEIARLSPNILACAGFSGHGVALAGLSGRVAAEAVAGRVERFDLMSRLPVPEFPGGRRLRAPLLTLAMTWFALRDRFGI